MLDCLAEKAREQRILYREGTPTERRVLGAFLYYGGLSYRRIGPFVERSHETVDQWFHRLKHLFEPDCKDRPWVAVDEMKVKVDGTEVFVWAAVDFETHTQEFGMCISCW